MRRSIREREYQGEGVRGRENGSEGVRKRGSDRHEEEV